MVTTHFLNLLAGNIFGTKKDTAIPTEYYLGLSKTAPTADGEGVGEPKENGYKRVALVSHLGEPANGVVKNKENVDFEESTGDWGELTHYVIFDEETGGKLLMAGALKKPRNVQSDTVMTAYTGEIELRVKDEEAEA